MNLEIYLPMAQVEPLALKFHPFITRISGQPSNAEHVTTSMLNDLCVSLSLAHMDSLKISEITLDGTLWKP